MASYLFGDNFIKYIQAMMPGSQIASGGTELICKCKYCNETSGHMYIHVPQDETDVAVFNCFKCHASGVIDSRRLVEWGIFDPVIASGLDDTLRKSATSGKIKVYNRIVYNVVNKTFDEQLAQTKCDYLNGRIGLSLSIQDWMNEKVIFNIQEVVDYNKCKYTRHPNIMSQLNKYFVGFLSFDNNSVNLRRTCDKNIVYEGIDKRYINYNIHDKKEDKEKFYICPGNIDLTLPLPVKVHIAEGPFDILSIKYNLRNCEPGIYCAIAGSGYAQMVMYIINVLRVFNMELHLYPDNDDCGNSNVMREIYEAIKPYYIPMFVHRNRSDGEKDFGVPSDRIIEEINTNPDYF